MEFKWLICPKATFLTLRCPASSKRAGFRGLRGNKWHKLTYLYHFNKNTNLNQKLNPQICTYRHKSISENLWRFVDQSCALPLSELFPFWKLLLLWWVHLKHICFWYVCWLQPFEPQTTQQSSTENFDTTRSDLAVPLWHFKIFRISFSFYKTHLKPLTFLSFLSLFARGDSPLLCLSSG